MVIQYPVSCCFVVMRGGRKVTSLFFFFFSLQPLLCFMQLMQRKTETSFRKYHGTLGLVRNGLNGYLGTVTDTTNQARGKESERRKN